MNGGNPVKTVEEFTKSLVEAGVLPDSAAKRQIAAHSATGHSFDTIVTELGLMREEALARALADYFNVVVIEDFLPDIDRERVRDIGMDFLSINAALPLRTADVSALTLIVANPFDTDSLKMIGYLIDKPIVLCIALRSEILVSATAIALEMNSQVETSMTMLEDASEGDLERLRDFAAQAISGSRLIGRV